MASILEIAVKLRYIDCGPLRKKLVKPVCAPRSMSRRRAVNARVVSIRSLSIESRGARFGIRLRLSKLPGIDAERRA